MRIINDDKFSISTDLVIAATAEDEHSYVLNDVFNHCKERYGKLIVTNLGSWSKETGLNVTLTEEKHERRKDFQGMKLKVIAVVGFFSFFTISNSSWSRDCRIKQNLNSQPQYRPDDVVVEDYLLDEGGKPLDSMTKFTYAILLSIGYMFNFT